ncbi:hypothetical protein AB1280_04685 [Bacillus sp. S10(2024)]
MEKENVFKWKHYQPNIILLTVRWYLRYNLSFLSGVEAMHMIKKKQVDLRNQSVQNQKEFIYQLFGLAA